MTVRPIIPVLALLVGVSPAFAQRQGPIQRWPTREGQAAPAPQPQGDQGGRREREAQPRTAPPPRAEQPSSPPVAQGQRRVAQPRTEREESSGDGQPQARARGGDQRQVRDRDRDDNQQGQARDRGDDRRVIQNRGNTPRVAVPRQGPAPRVTPGRRGDTNVYIVRPPAYRYTPRFNRPYVYGAYGPGYFYYGSYGWYPRATYYYDRGYFGRGYGYDVGEVRLDIEPQWAEVYVDGFFAGAVDEFDGIFQSLKLESGPYHIEIVAPGFEPLEVDLRVSPGQKITYRANMRREF